MAAKTFQETFWGYLNLFQRKHWKPTADLSICQQTSQILRQSWELSWVWADSGMLGWLLFKIIKVLILLILIGLKHGGHYLLRGSYPFWIANNRSFKKTQSAITVYPRRGRNIWTLYKSRFQANGFLSG